jgi:hypothetical protein
VIAAMAAAEGFFDLYGRGARVDAVIRAMRSCTFGPSGNAGPSPRQS